MSRSHREKISSVDLILLFPRGPKSLSDSAFPRLALVNYAGVCIDPFSPKVPAAERYPGLEMLYALPSSGSTLLTIEGCHIRGFVTGVVISPGLLANAENILIADTTIESTVSAVAICQDQSRHVVLRDVNILGAKYAINCVEYGNGNGNSPSIFGARIAGTRHIFHAIAFGSAYAIKGLLAESFWSIGQLDGDPNFDGYVFDGCRFTFGRLPATLDTLDAHLLNYTNTVFNGCTFAFAPGEPQDPGPIKLYVSSQATLSLNGCVFYTDVPEISASWRTSAPLWICESQDRVSYHGCVIQTPQQTHALSAIYPPSAPRFASQMGPPRLAPPGSLHPQNTLYPALPPLGNQDAGALSFAPVSSLRWVSGVYPRIWLGDVTLKEDPPGTLSYELDLATIESIPDLNIQRAMGTLGADHILLPGDLIFAVAALAEITLPIRDNLRPRRAGNVVLGRFGGVSSKPMMMPPPRVFLEQVPAAVWQEVRKRQGMMKPLTARLYASYLPKIHPATSGTVEHGSDRVSHVFCDVSLDRGTAWRPGDRIRGDWIAPGAFILRIVDRSTLQLSVAAWDPQNDMPPDPEMPLTRRIRLYDADVRALALV